MKMLEETTPVQVRPEFGQKSLDRALGDAALEGLRPTPAALADLQQVAAGELTGDEYLQRLRERYQNGL